MNILIISQHLFPCQTPRAHRTSELIKEFSRQGHSVIVYAVLGKFDYSEFENKFHVTVKNIPISLQFSPYNSDGNSYRNFFDKLFGKLFRKLFEFPNIEFMFNVPKLIKQEKNIDLLLTIADPHPIHWGCARAKNTISENFPKVWIADCGDPFMQNGANKKHFSFYGRFEKSFCKHCDYVTVPVKEAIGAYYEEFRSKFQVIPQGFDFDMHLTNTKLPNNTKPIFAYAGTFYKDFRNPFLFLEYLSTLKLDFKFIIYTKHKDLVLPFKNILKEKLEIHDSISREELMTVFRKMDFLVNLENYDKPHQLPSKLIDYSIANRPILSINTLALNTDIIDAFLRGDYSKKYIVEDLQEYHISNVVNKFIELTKNRIS